MTRQRDKSRQLASVGRWPQLPYMYILVLNNFFIISCIPEAEYEGKCEELEAEYSRSKPSSKVIRRVMRSTFQQRRHWMVTDAPTIAEALEKFPPRRPANM